MDIDPSMLVSKPDLASLKTKLDNLDPDNLKTVPADLSKVSNAVDNDVVKKTVYDKLVMSMLLILRYHRLLVTKTQYDSDKQSLEKKIEDVDKKITYTTGLFKKTDYNTEITEIENKIPSATRLVTTGPFYTKVTKQNTRHY